MRNLVLALVVALLAVPAFAAAPALDLVAGTGGVVTLNYTTNGSLISGMGLKITATNGAVFSNYADGAQGTKYWVHPSNILIDGLGNLTSKGSAVASNDANGLMLEYGALYVRSDPCDTNKPATSGTLCTFKVDKACRVTVEATYAGGVVTEDFNSFALTDFVDATVCTLDLNGNKADISGYNNSWSSGAKDGKVDLLDFSFLTYKNWWLKTCSTLTGTNQTNCVKADISGLNNSWSSGQPDGKVDLLDFSFMTYKNWWNKPTCR